MDPEFDDMPDDIGSAATETTVAGAQAATQPQVLDINEDHVVDSLFFQVDENISYLVVDTDQNGDLDTTFFDLNGDGETDLIVQETPEGYLLTDPTGANETQLLTRDELVSIAPDLVNELDLQLPQADPVSVDPAPDRGWEIDDHGQLIGDPQGASEHWFQQAVNGFCMPASIAQVVSEYTGQHFADEQAFVQLANEVGAFSVGPDGVPGVPFEKGVDILNAAGVPAEYTFGDLETLATDLAEGDSIILFVDSGELWYGEATEDDAPDHAVVITGIDVERGVVYLSDPGSADGNMHEYPLDQFLGSWQDSNNAMIVSPEPSPGGEVTQVDTEIQTDAASTDAADTDRPAVGTGGPLDLHLGEKQGFFDQATSIALRNPWIILPVAVAAGHLSRHLSR